MMSHNRRQMKAFAKTGVKTLVLLVVGLLFVAPLLWMVSSSLKAPLEVFKTPFCWIPDRPRWDNYVNIWTNKTMPFLLLYYNSTKIALLSILGRVLVSSLAAYAFAKIHFTGKQLVFTLFLASIMIPGQVMIIPRFVLFHNIGLYDNHWALILPSWVNVTSIFLLVQFYKSMADELVDAAKVDGASHLQIWWRIIMPLTKPPMISIVILGFIGSWDDYLSPLVFLVSRQLYTVAQGVNYYYTMEAAKFNLVMAAATSAIVPIVLLFVFSQNFFVQGITKTGLKN